MLHSQSSFSSWPISDHLVGRGDSKSRNLYKETGCYAIYSRYNKEKGEPMKVTIMADSSAAVIENAIKRVEKSLFGYIKDESAAQGRLHFELRHSTLANRHYLPVAENGAVWVSNCWVQLVEMNCLNKDWTNAVYSGRESDFIDLYSVVYHATECNVSIHVDSPKTPLKSCRPYIMIQGSDWKRVEKAAAIITQEPRTSRKRWGIVR